LFLAFEEIDTKKVAFQIQFPSTAWTGFLVYEMPPE
jgi:hypothetical protein